MAIQDLNIQ